MITLHQERRSKLWYSILVAIVFLIPFTTYAAPALIQVKGLGQGGGSSISANVSSTATGNLIVACLYSSNATSTSVTDNRSNVYTLGGRIFRSGASGDEVSLYYAYNTTSSVTSVTANFAAWSSASNIIIGEYSGIATSSPLDQARGYDNGWSGGASWTTGIASTTNQANDLLVGCTGDAQGGSPTYTAGGGYTAEKTQTSLFLEDKVVSATGAYTATGTQSLASSYEILANLAAFKVAVSSLSAPAISSFTPASSTIISGASTTLSWTVTGNPTPTVTINQGIGSVSATGSTSITPATTTIYTLTATNSQGTTTASTTVTVTAAPTAPTPPQSVSASPGNAQATISFTAPTSTGGSSILYYTAIASPGGSSATSSGSPITVTGLTNGTSYTFAVTATNAIGTSSSSASSSPIIPTAPITINAFSAVPSALTIGSSTVFSWSITGTVSTTTITGNNLNLTTSTASGTITVTPNATGTLTYALIATNANTSSTASTSVTVSTIPTGVSLVHVTGVTQGGGSSITTAVSSTSPGDFMLVCLSTSGNLSTSVTDNNGRNYALASRGTQGGTTSEVSIYYAPNTAANVNSITATFAGYATISRMIIAEYNGIATTNPLDQGVAYDNAWNGGSNWTTGMASTTNQANDLLVGCAGDSYGNAATFTAGGGYTGEATQTSLFLDDKLVSATGIYAATGTHNLASGYEILAAGASFKNAAPSAPAISSFTPASSTIISGASTTLSWTVTGNPTPTVTINQGIGSVSSTGSISISPATTTIYTLTATNSQGTTTASTTVTVTPLAPPTPPQSLSATAGNGSVALSWTAPTSTGGSLITQYIIEDRLTGSSTFANIATTSLAQLSYTVTSLTNGTSYDFAVIAQNAIGISSPSSIISATPTTTTQSSSSSSGAPVIFFTDLVSGPNTGGENNNGVYVTIFGKNFGTNPIVTVGGGTVAQIKLTPTSWMWYQKMTVQLGSLAQTGNIVISNASGTSNSAPFTVRAGNIYFVATTGSDSNDGSFSHPWATLLHARDSIAAGDTVYAMDGVSQTADDGQGWNAAMLIRNSGTAAAGPMAIVGYPGATVTIGNTSASPGFGIRSYDTISGYWVFANLHLTGSTALDTSGPNAPATPSTNWRIVGNDITCPNGNGEAGCLTTQNSTYVYTYGNNVHNTGVLNASAHYHAVYFTTDTNHVWMGYNTVAYVHGCRGIQVHSSALGSGGASDPTGHPVYDYHIFSNVIHDTQCDGMILATMDPSQGTVEVYNNIIYNAGTGPDNPENSGGWTCIAVDGYTSGGTMGSGTVDVYNNTLYNCGSFASPPYANSNAAIENGGNNPNLYVRIRNNIAYQLSAPYLIVYTNNALLYGSNNLFYGYGGAPNPTYVTSSTIADPLFVSTSTSNFHLSASSSPAVDGGLTLASLAMDADGVGRPQGNTYDLGAYEYAINTTYPPAISSFTPVSSTIISGASTTLSWTVTGNPTPTVTINQGIGSVSATGSTSITPATTTIYTLTATNSQGTTTASTSVTVTAAPTIPSAPQSLVAMSGNAKALLSWSVPVSDGGSALTQYLVYGRRTGSSTFALYATTTPSQTTFTVSSLTNGISYDFEIIAQNGVGISTASNIASTTPLLSISISSFSLPATSTSLVVPISSFTVNGTPAGYFLSESSSTPSSTNPAWTVDLPVSYAFGAAASSHTLYAWVKDSSSTISFLASSTVSFPYYVISARDPIQSFITPGIVTSTAPNLASTTAIVFAYPVVVALDSNAVMIWVPASTTFQTASSSDFTALVATTSVVTSDLPTNMTPVVAVQYGLATTSISLTKPITFNISVGSSYESQTLEVYRKDTGTIWQDLGTCTVTQATCSFATNNLSSFAVTIPIVVATPSTTTNNSGGGGGGGGGGSYATPSVVTTPATSNSLSDNAAILTSLVAQLRLLTVQLFLDSNTQNRNLTIGSHGADVWALQILLILDSSGPQAAKLAAISPTGTFGILTQAAVKEYQTQQGIVPISGTVGPKTRAALLQ